MIRRLTNARATLRASLPGSRRLLVFLLVVPLVTGLFGAPGARVATADELSDALAQQKALAAKIADQKAAIARLNALEAGLSDDIAQTKTTLAGVNADLTVVQAKVTRIKTDIAVVRTAYDDLVNQLLLLDLQLGRLQDKQVRKAAELAQHKAMLAQRLRAAYDTGETSLLETLLSADSFADALADVGYYLDIGDQDQALARQVQQDQATLSALQATVSMTRDQTEGLRAETAAQKAKLDARLSDLKAAQAQLKVLQVETQRQLALQAAAYRKLAANKTAAAKALIQAAKTQRSVNVKINNLLAAQFLGGNIPSKYNGSFTWPLSGTLTQEFGCTGFIWEPPLGSCTHFHIGIDIAAPMYTPVRAAGAGRVLYEGPLSDGAWVVIIAHAQNLVTLYGHLDNRVRPPRVRAGQVVQQGQVIGYVGMTGNTTGPHLHWGVELDGTWVNPRLFL